MLPETSRTFIRAIAYAGCVPFVVMAALMWLVTDATLHGFVATSLSSYAALIVGFQAGIHWGIGLRTGVDAPKLHFVWGAICAFCGWFGALMYPAAGLPFMAVVFVVCYVVDDRTWDKAGLSEWMNLRFHGTFVAVTSCLAGAAASA